jgi:hypothetical protein
MEHSLVGAYHEAGHAIIGHLLGFKIRRVRINPDGDGGKTSISGLAAPEQINNLDWKARSLAERIIITTLAGPYAQRRAAPRSDWRQRRHSHHLTGDTDFSIVDTLIDCMHGTDDKVARCHLRYLEARPRDRSSRNGNGSSTWRPRCMIARP